MTLDDLNSVTKFRYYVTGVIDSQVVTELWKEGKSPILYGCIRKFGYGPIINGIAEIFAIREFKTKIPTQTRIVVTAMSVCLIVLRSKSKKSQ